MLKNKVKALEKRVSKMTKSKMNGVFFVDLLDGMYSVRKAMGGGIIFQGDKQSFNEYSRKHEESVFIIDDIPRSKGEESWLNYAD